MKRVYCNRSRRRVMPIDEDGVSPLKSRERRRRRIEARRRLVSASAAVGVDNPEAQKLADAELEDENASSSSAIANLISDNEKSVIPVYGCMSVVGRAREMEDEVSIRMNLCRPEINNYRPVHFFGVFDGHGGHHVSALCKENMHVIMEEELMRVKVTEELPTEGGLEELWRTAITRSFERMDEMAMQSCQCNGLETWKICKYHPHLSLVGSTAVVSLLTEKYIIVANCGDSRAVLSRNGKAVPLSIDHKPEREDERTRIEACGGRIVFMGNGARVEGVLAMSRAIGDRLLKQVVSCEPEYSFTKREEGDTCMILGSDGLWDVLSNEVSCEVVQKCSQQHHVQNCNVRPPARGRRGNSAMISAASLLVRLAIGRRSSDNISVIVVDLRNSNLLIQDT